MIKFTIPFESGISKNKKYVSKTSKVLHPDYRRIKNSIALISKLKSKGKEFKNKIDTCIIIVVYLPNKRHDAHNCLQCLLDGLQEGIGVTDNYYQMVNLERHYDKDNPRIEVTCWQ